MVGQGPNEGVVMEQQGGNKLAGIAPGEVVRRAVAPSRLTIASLPDGVLVRVVEFLGTPPGDSDAVEVNVFVRDILSMAATCRRWKAVVQSSGDVWQAVCVSRWPWLTSESDRDLGISGDGKNDRAAWMDLCLRMGNRLMRAGIHHRRPRDLWTLPTFGSLQGGISLVP